MTVDRLRNETEEYRKQRAELLEAEIALMEERERVAALRRALPPGPEIETDWVLREGDREVRVSELFDEGQDSLVMVHFMYGSSQKNPCPMCTMWADGYDAVAQHVRRRTSFAVVFEGDMEAMQAHARNRGWTNLRLLSSGGSTLKRDLRMADEDGGQHPGLSVFTRDTGGAVRHQYTVEALMAAETGRGVDLMSPVWHIFDLLPDGRGEFFPSLRYDRA